MRQLREATIPRELLHLPHKALESVSKGRVIYDCSQPSDHLYAVINGRVKITVTSTNGRETISRIVPTDGLFGESCLVGRRPDNEGARALVETTLISWSASEIEQCVIRNPQLGISLYQYAVSQCMELLDRIEDAAVCRVPERVMLAFVRLARAMGAPTREGIVRVPSLTHRTVAEYVGTSREIVSSHMNALRRKGFLKYSRKYIEVHLPAIEEELRRQGISIQAAPVAVTGASVQSPQDDDISSPATFSGAPLCASGST